MQIMMFCDGSSSMKENVQSLNAHIGYPLYTFELNKSKVFLRPGDFEAD